MRALDRAILMTIAAAFLVAAQVDPPGRVARLNYLAGRVSFQPGGADEWVGAPLNRPLTAGDRLWVEQDGRAELHMGSAAVRLSSQTSFEFLNLNDDNVQIRLSEGSVEIRLRRLDENESFEVDTPNLAFSLLRPGIYRIDANPDSQTTFITVRGGEGQVSGGGQFFSVKPGQQATVTGDQSVTYDLGAARPPDWFDDFCSSRDRREDRSESARYVPREMIGYEDLDDQGSWRPVPEYGQVWFPRTVSAGWAPYRHGHWAWVEPWGWTWVDEATWGFAPFHYGRWAFIGSSWGWCPGAIAVRPVYAPALVAWVGGPRFNASIGIGAGVAWFPLGPREAFVPSYRSSAAYATRVNNTTVINNVRVTNINNVTYVNQTAPNAVTAVSRETFVGGRRIGSSAVPVSAQAVASAEVVRGAQVAPSRASLYGEGRSGAQAPPAAVLSRTVVTRRAPPPAAIPFAQRQEALQQNQGRPLEPAQVERIRAQNPVQAQPARVERVRTLGQEPVPQLSPQQRMERQARPERVTPEIRQETNPQVAPQPQQRMERQARPERVTPEIRQETTPQVSPQSQQRMERQARPERVTPEIRQETNPQVTPQPQPRMERQARPERATPEIRQETSPQVAPQPQQRMERQARPERATPETPQPQPHVERERPQRPERQPAEVRRVEPVERAQPRPERAVQQERHEERKPAENKEKEKPKEDRKP